MYTNIFFGFRKCHIMVITIIAYIVTLTTRGESGITSPPRPKRRVCWSQTEERASLKRGEENWLAGIHRNCNSSFWYRFPHTYTHTCRERDLALSLATFFFPLCGDVIPWSLPCGGNTSPLWEKAFFLISFFLFWFLCSTEFSIRGNSV